MFNVQTRLLKLEQELNLNKEEFKTTDDAASKRIASTRAELEKIFRELQQIRGELDTLRMGVITGEMPGSQQRQGSVAASISDLTSRVEAVEQAQEELLDAIRSAGVKRAKKRARAPSKNVEELKEDFNKKRYKYVAEDAPKLLSSASGEDKFKVQFFHAESLYKLGKLRDAALKFNDLLESGPSKEFVPHAKMRMGDCFRHLGDEETARVYYQELISEYPDSEEAATAKERMAELG